MADGRGFGQIINERRLELGYSLGQLANRMGTTATTVRGWERGNDIPDDDVVAKLADELDIDVDELSSAISSPPETTSPSDEESVEPTAEVIAPLFSDESDTGAALAEDTAPVDEGLIEEAVDEPVQTSPDAEEPDKEETQDLDGDASQAADDLAAIPVIDSGDAASDDGGGAGDTDVGADADLDGGAAEDDGSRGMAVEAATAVVVAGAGAPSPPPPSADPGLTDLPTEAVPVVTATPEPAFGAAVMAPAAAVPTAPPSSPAPTEPTGPFAPLENAYRALFDPDRKYLFWLRTALTLILFLIFFRILVWAVPAFFDTLADLLDTIESTPTDTTIVFESG